MIWIVELPTATLAFIRMKREPKFIITNGFFEILRSFFEIERTVRDTCRSIDLAARYDSDQEHYIGPDYSASIGVYTPSERPK